LIVYPDSSFVVSGYVANINSLEVVRRMALRPTLAITPFHRAEVINALYQWVFRGRFSAADADLARAKFEQDCKAGVWELIDFPVLAFDVCPRLARRHTGMLGVRTLDTLHVAAALELNADAFWTVDERQKRLAEIEGLNVR